MTLASSATSTVAWSQDEASKHHVSIGAYYSEGDYGQPVDTSIRYFPFAYDYTISNWNFKVAAPHISISGLGNVLVNVGGVGRNDLDAFNPSLLEATTSSGMGDTVVTATYQMPSFSPTAPFIDLAFEVKFPTANENKGLGTGEHDYGLQVDIYQLVGGVTLFGTVGYKFRGHSTLFDEMTDSGYASLGFSAPLGATWSYGVIYDFREAASESSMETHELLPFLSWVPAPRWSVMTYVAKGFTRDSADLAVGTQLGYRW